MCSNGLSEEIIGTALRVHGMLRQKVVIMTKCGFAVGEDQHVVGGAFKAQMGQSKDYVKQGGE